MAAQQARCIWLNYSLLEAIQSCIQTKAWLATNLSCQLWHRKELLLCPTRHLSGEHTPLTVNEFWLETLTPDGKRRACGKRRVDYYFNFFFQFEITSVLCFLSPAGMKEEEVFVRSRGVWTEVSDESSATPATLTHLRLISSGSVEVNMHHRFLSVASLHCLCIHLFFPIGLHSALQMTLPINRLQSPLV